MQIRPALLHDPAGDAGGHCAGATVPPIPPDDPPPTPALPPTPVVPPPPLAGRAFDVPINVASAIEAAIIAARAPIGVHAVDDPLTVLTLTAYSVSWYV